MLYVAYGSNINRAQMKSRCPGAKVYGQGILNNYRLEFHGTDGNAKATVVNHNGSKVPIVIWDLPQKEISKMDIYEGYPTVYTKKFITISINGEKQKCLIYLKNKSPIARPSRKYVNTIRWGYDNFHLDLKFLENALSYNSEAYYKDNIYELREIKTTSLKPLKKNVKAYNKPVKLKDGIKAESFSNENFWRSELPYSLYRSQR